MKAREGVKMHESDSAFLRMGQPAEGKVIYREVSSDRVRENAFSLVARFKDEGIITADEEILWKKNLSNNLEPEEISW